MQLNLYSHNESNKYVILQNMKKIILSLSILMGCLSMYAADKGVLRIVGNLRDAGESLVITQLENRRAGRVDSFPVKDGKFDINLKMEKPMLLYITKAQQRSAQPRARRATIQIVGVPGETLQLVGTMNTPTILGSKFYQQYVEMEDALKPFQAESAALRQQTDRMIAAGGNRDEIMNKYQEGTAKIRQRTEEAIVNFAKAHPDNEATVTYLERVNPRQWENYLGNLSPAVRDGRMKAYYQPMVDMIKQQMERQDRAAKLQEPGREVPDFTLMDINGKPLSLSSLRGKYVVLDFWGSWCGWCIKGYPDMKKYYEKYKGKFEILGIDCNDTEEKWKKAVADNQLPWLHVYNKKDDNDVTKLFGITGYPTKIIIDPQGKIARSFIGEGPAFYTYLDENFQ